MTREQAQEAMAALFQRFQVPWLFKGKLQSALISAVKDPEIGPEAMKTAFAAAVDAAVVLAKD